MHFICLHKPFHGPNLPFVSEKLLQYNLSRLYISLGYSKSNINLAQIWSKSLTYISVCLLQHAQSLLPCSMQAKITRQFSLNFIVTTTHLSNWWFNFFILSSGAGYVSKVLTHWVWIQITPFCIRYPNQEESSEIITQHVMKKQTDKTSLVTTS